MNKFTVIAAFAAIGGGLVRITEQQAKTRLHNLEPVKGSDGVYKVVKPIQFKKGEEFEHDGTPNKAQAQMFEAAVTSEVKENKKPKTDAAGK